MLAGARSVTAIAEWAADTLLTALGLHISCHGWLRNSCGGGRACPVRARADAQ
jgi:hypothetical protein